MPFMLYTDAKMTVEVSNPYQMNFNGTGDCDVLLFFGSPDASEILRPKTDQKIMLIPSSRLKKWQPNLAFGVGSIIEPVTPNGCMYQSVNNVATGSNEPAWSQEQGSKCSSGGAIFVNLGAKFQPADVSLSLTADGLNSANGGQALALGAELQGGRAMPIYMRVSNHNGGVRSDRSDPCISIRLNATTTTTAA